MYINNYHCRDYSTHIQHAITGNINTFTHHFTNGSIVPLLNGRSVHSFTQTCISPVCGVLLPTVQPQKGHYYSFYTAFVSTAKDVRSLTLRCLQKETQSYSHISTHCHVMVKMHRTGWSNSLWQSEISKHIISGRGYCHIFTTEMSEQGDAFLFYFAKQLSGFCK